MTIQTIYQRALRSYGAATSTFFTSTHCKQFFEEVEREGCQMVPGLYGCTFATIVTASATRAPKPNARLFAYKWVEYKGRRLNETDEDALYRDEGRSWRTTKAKSTPTHWYRDVADGIGLFPRPTGGSGGALRVYGYQAMTGGYASGACTARTPAVYALSFVPGICERMADMDKDRDRAGQWKQAHGQDWQKALAIMARDYAPKDPENLRARFYAEPYEHRAVAK